jgi:hypothetical protein
MRNIYAFLFTIGLFLTSITYSHAQRLEKIRGNKIVVDVTTEIPAFTALDLDENFEIDLMYSVAPFVAITTDENLHEVIEFKVQDSVLRFNTLKHITSKKQLHIKVGYTNALHSISATGSAVINSITPLNFKHCNLEINGESRLNLTISATHFNLKSDEKSKATLNLTADTTTISLQGTSKIEALINTTKFSSYINEKANADIEGNCHHAYITVDNNTTFQGKNFTINTCNVSCDTSGKAILEVIKAVTLKASGSSAVYLYQNPKIIVEELSGTSKIQKKLK